MKIYDDNDCVTIPILTDEELAESNQAGYVKTDRENTFPELLARYVNELKNKGFIEQDISAVTGLTKSVISQYLNGKKVPSIESLSALCIGMRLYPERSELLISMANRGLSKFAPRDRIIIRYLTFCPVREDYTVISCNRELVENHFLPLTSL